MTFSPNCSGTLADPSLIVVHYTASGTFEGTRSWFLDKKSKVSAHELIGRQGEWANLVPYDKCAWHCGPSSWRGLYGINRYSIGIELVGWGPLKAQHDGTFVSAMTGKPATDAVHAPLGSYEWWQGYTEIQLAKLNERIHALFKDYPSLREVVGHRDISPGRKQDPWPMDVQKEFAGFKR